MKKIFYYVLGQTVSGAYHNSGIEEALEVAKSDESFDVIKFNRNTQSPTKLLEATEGWYGYAEITPAEYKRFLKVRNS